MTSVRGSPFVFNGRPEKKAQKAIAEFAKNQFLVEMRV
jgi:hypothetical protein